MLKKWDIRATREDAPRMEQSFPPQTGCTTDFADSAKIPTILPMFDIRRIKHVGVCLLIGPNLNHILKIFRSNAELRDWLMEENRI